MRQEYHSPPQEEEIARMRAGVTRGDEQAEGAEHARRVELGERPRGRKAAAFGFVPGITGHERAGTLGRAVTAVSAGGEKCGGLAAQLRGDEQREVLIASSRRCAGRN